ncbi:MAG: DNA-binding domain-containing protein [Microcoleaceae cyanobacterium]
MELRQLQQDFYQAIFESDTTDALSQAYLNSSENFTVYRNSIVGTLTRTLESIYPVCYRLVGEQFFTATARVYIHRYPSVSPDLGKYGHAFAEFLSEFKPAAGLPYLPDLARLEWHWHCVFHGKITNTLDYQALGKIPQDQWGEIIFNLPQNSILLSSIYPIHRIWQVNQPDDQTDEQVNLNQAGSHIFLWRDNYDMRMDLPTLTEWQLLQAFQTKNQLEIICENLANLEPSVDVAALLPLFVQRGWIVNFLI